MNGTLVHPRGVRMRNCAKLGSRPTANMISSRLENLNVKREEFGAPDQQQFGTPSKTFHRKDLLTWYKVSRQNHKPELTLIKGSNLEALQVVAGHR